MRGPCSRDDESTYIIENEYYCHILEGGKSYPASGLVPYFEGMCGLRPYFDYCYDYPFQFNLAFVYEYARPFLMIFQEKHGEAMELIEIKSMNSDYSKSYQTRKSIPKSTLEAMRDSELNKVFGFVEYDANCDLSLVHDKEKEIMTFIDAFFPFVDASNISLRFRALGNHHANGLFYPSVMCMCVDYRHIYSFVHEFGHLIDHLYGNLSWKPDFATIRLLYQEILYANGGKKLFSANSKYNLDYYLMPTEVFARSMEMYFAIVKGVRNGLLPIEFKGPQYPVGDSYFIEEITEYFDHLFNRLDNGRKPTTEVYDPNHHHSVS